MKFYEDGLVVLTSEEVLVLKEIGRDLTKLKYSTDLSNTYNTAIIIYLNNVARSPSFLSFAKHMIYEIIKETKDVGYQIKYADFVAKISVIIGLYDLWLQSSD